MAQRGIATLGLLVGAIVGGCSDSGARANSGNSGQGTDVADTDNSASDTATGGDAGATADGGDDIPPCPACDDDDPCTKDTCPADACLHEPVLDNDCRPSIDVDFPPRAATVQGSLDDRTIFVSGGAYSGLGEVSSIRINGTEVPVDAQGRFGYAVATTLGPNTLVFEVEDSAGNQRRRVQSFLWSSEFREPSTPPEQIVPQGLGFWLGQAALDDGDHTQPPNDLATVIDLGLGALDLNRFADSDHEIASSAGYDVYLTALRMGDSSVSLHAADGGIRVVATLHNIEGDLDFDCTNLACQLAGGDSSGGLTMAQVEVTGMLQMGVDSDAHRLTATLTDVHAEVNSDDVEIWANDGWTDFLLSAVELFIHNSLVSDLEDALEEQIGEHLGPVLADAVGGLSLSTQFDFPNLARSRQSIPVELITEFVATAFQDGVAPPQPSLPAGGGVILQAGGYPTLFVTPYDNDGVPSRMGCGTGVQNIGAPLTHPVEIALADDTLNQLLFAGWRGGLLEFPLSPDTGGLLQNLQVKISGMLAPTVSDCDAEGQLLATLGDVRIDASFQVNGSPVEFTAFTTLVVELALNSSDTQVRLDLAQVVRTETELTSDDDHIAQEPFYIELLESQLIDSLLNKIGSSGFANITLPHVDLSDPLDLQPGTGRLQVHADTVIRQDGNTVIQGHF